MDETRLLASRPEELLEVVPYLLGFKPQESLVLVCLRERRVVCTARVDLAAVRDVEEAQALVQRVAASTRLEALIAVAYAKSRDAAAQALCMVECAVGEEQLMDLLWVHGLQWESLSHDGSGCYDDSGALAAAAVYAGLSAARDRASVVAAVEPVAASEATAAALSAAEDRWRLARSTRRARELHRLTGVAPESLTPDDAATLTVLLGDPVLRDRVLLRLDRDSGREGLEFWLRLAPLLPDEPRASHPLGILGMHAWLAGEGALAVAALQRGQRLGVEAGLLSVLETINELALSPEWWEQLRCELVA